MKVPETTDFTDKLVKEKGWYRDIEREWELKNYGFYAKGMSDLIFNNMLKIIKDDDTSKWAQDVFDKCVILLIQGKRWPDEMQEGIEMFIGQTRISRLITKIRWKRGKTDMIKYRHQKSMTRDPWTLFYAACIHLDRREYIALKPPVRLYVPELWELRKALLGRKNHYLFFKKLDELLFKPKDFVKVLDYYKEWCYERR